MVFRHSYYLPGIYDDFREYPDYDSYDKNNINYKDVTFDPEKVKCDDCDCKLNENDIKYKNSLLFGLSISTQVQVGEWICSDCLKLFRYDGLCDHLFHYRDGNLYEHSLLNEFGLCIKQDSSISFFNFYTKTNDRYLANGSKLEVPARSHLTLVHRSFALQQQWPLMNVCPYCDRGLRVNWPTMTIEGSPTGECDTVGMFSEVFWVILMNF